MFSKASSRLLEEVFSVTNFRLPRRLPKTSSRRFQDFFKTCLEDVFKTSSRRRHLVIISWRRLHDVLKVSWKTKNVTLKASYSVRLHQGEYLLGYNIAVIYTWNLLFSLKVADFVTVSIVFFIYKQNFMAQ